MVAITRWVRYNVDAVGSAVTGGTNGLGTSAWAFGTDSVDISTGIDIGPTTNRLYIQIDTNDPTDPVTSQVGFITLYSGSDLDPRFVARDITEKLHAAGAGEEFTHATCLWEDVYWEDTPNVYFSATKFKIYSGTLGTSSDVLVATSGTNSAHTILGFTSGNVETGGGAASSNNDPADPYISISGTYTGFFDETYRVVISNDTHDGGGTSTTRGVDEGSIVKSITYDGTMTLGGLYNGAVNTTYTLTIDVTNGTTMGAGTGNVPRMRWVSSGGTDDMKAGYYVELLYPDHWYHLGTKGLMVKFTDAVFGAGTWSIPCYAPDYSHGTNGNGAIGDAYYIFASDRGDDGASPVQTVSGSYTALGSKGLYITFSGSNNLYAGDEFYIHCAGPHPGAQANYNITSLNYGNVTVATHSDVKAVMFEIESGAQYMSTVKFGLQNHGTFSHHAENNDDTEFRFGTVGPDNIKNGYEWRQNVDANNDLNQVSPPAYLYAVEKELQVVSTADASESVGNTGLTSDPIWVTIYLGASETGANSTINYRLYFDYS